MAWRVRENAPVITAWEAIEIHRILYVKVFFTLATATARPSTTRGW
jgi:hypothetical protein